MANRLAHSSSPYLLQHRHNPVDWYPWGPEAFAVARERGVPIFLSIGYSTCYWCHVMERQCFENPAIAAEMNRRFVNVKVDREEHPDVDQLYMTAVQVLTRQGGWPLSVFLTPDLRPFYGGTYFPPEDMPDGRGGGRPGFPRLLASIDEAWRERRGQIEQTADQLLSVLHQLSLPRRFEGGGEGEPVVWGEEKLRELVSRSAADYEPVHGGFGRAPKFPRQTLLQLLAEFGDLGAGRETQMLAHTLDAMARGGIRDQLGGGFHRYSTDARWLVPHFEIMLYDQAMLAGVYGGVYGADGSKRQAGEWGEVARGVCEFVLREMTGSGGEFHTALDAEVDGREGENYLWTAEEIRAVLGPEDAALFGCVYGVDQGPNFRDPHHPDAEMKNILFLDRPVAQAAFEHGIAEAELRERLAAMRAKLKAVRDRRRQPLLDDKVITGWNALMATALARCGRALGEPTFVAAAERNVRWLLKHHVTAEGRVLRSSRGGRVREEGGILDDYAYLAEACLAVGGAEMRQHAQRIAGEMLRRFGSESGACGGSGEGGGLGCSSCGGGTAGACTGCEGGGGLYYTEEESESGGGGVGLIVRQKVGTDSPLPNGNAVAAGVLLELGQTDRAAAILADFAQSMEDNAEAMSAMVTALGRYVRQVGPLKLKARGGGARREAGDEQDGRGAVELSARLDESGVLEVRVEIAAGYYLYAPPRGANGENGDGENGVRPLRLEMEGGRVAYPPGRKKVLVAGEDAIEVYEGDVVLRVEGGAGTGMPGVGPGGSRRWKGVLSYQACDAAAGRCLMPVTRTLEIEV